MSKTPQEMRIDDAFKQLKMPGAARVYRSLIREAEERGQSMEAFLATLLDQELHNRHENQLRERMREARFPMVKTLDSFDFTAQPSVDKTRILTLAKADFVKNRENVVLVGSPGTGKTHLATALGVAAIHAGRRVRFVTVAALANDLLAAQAEHRLNKALASWRRVECTILDELGFVPLSRDGAQLLFQFCADRYERGSLVITTNLDFARWTEVFGDAQMTAALLDRVTHRCHIVEHTGESYRFRESLKRKDLSPSA